MALRRCARNKDHNPKKCFIDKYFLPLKRLHIVSKQPRPTERGSVYARGLDPWVDTTRIFGTTRCKAERANRHCFPPATYPGEENLLRATSLVPEPTLRTSRRLPAQELSQQQRRSTARERTPRRPSAARESTLQQPRCAAQESTSLHRRFTVESTSQLQFAARESTPQQRRSAAPEFTLQQQQQQQKDGIFDGVASKLVQIMNDYVEIIPQTGNQLGFKFRNAAGLGPQMQPSARPCTMTPQQYEYAHPQPVLWHGLANNYVHGPHAHQPVCTYAVPETAPRRNVWWQSDAPLPIAVSGSGRAYSPPVADIPILRHTNRRGITLDPRPGPMRQCDAVRSALARARPERTPRDPGRRTNVTDQAKNASDAANVWSSEAPSGGVQIDDARSGDARSGDARSGDARSDGARSAALEPPQRQTRSTESSAKVVSTGKHVKVPRVASGGTVGMQVQRTATAQSDKSHERQSWRVSQGMDYKSKVSHRSSDLPAQPMPRARMARRKTRMAPVAQLGGIASASVSAGELDIIVASSAAEPDTSAASVGAEPDISAASAGSEPDISAASVGHGPGTSVASGMLALPPVPAPVGGRRRRRPTTTAPPVMGPQRNSDGDIISPAELEEAGWFASTPGGGESQENADEDAGAGVGWFG
eukprot:GEMP01023043.1.p1 GENE.GEMP01023043.1~~GEMP01023043.1.p1  ORF type:complete len:662 (+),score=176.38 GEMP01023043.1:44-1987(+)